MLRRAYALRCPTKLSVPPFYQSGGLNKPIADVLKECRPLDSARWDDALKILDSAWITTAGNWLKLPDDRKQKLEDAGLPYAVISDLNDAVRVGLLMPSFKFRPACEFIKTKGYDDFTNSSVADEARSVLQFAELVDASWILTRADCDALCHNYQRLVELTLKMALQGWHNGTDTKFTHYEDLPVDDGSLHPAKYYKRFKNSHDLGYLAKEVEKHASTFGGLTLPSEKSLNRITQCAGDTVSGKGALKQTSASASKPGKRISCHDFFDQAEIISPYLLKVWQTMDVNPPKHQGYDADIVWVAKKTKK